MKLICISDTHGHHNITVPDGDVLIHAGDITMKGERGITIAFNNWLGTLPHKHKIVIAGNHDFNFERDETARKLLTNCTYLQDEETVIDGVKFYGSPWQPWFHNWAFNLQRGEEIRRMWDKIPMGTDVLITHGPPLRILDLCPDGSEVGCADLLDEVYNVSPKIHVFGHIHNAYGLTKRAGITFVNASVCDEDYAPTNAPIVVEI